MWYSPPIGKNRTMITRTCNSTFGIHDDSFPLHHLWHVNFFSAAWIPSSRTLFLLVDNRSESYWEEFRLALPSSVTTNRSILDFQVIGVPENGRPMTYFNASWLMTMYSSRYCDHLWHIDTYGWTFKLGICTQVSKSIRCRRFPQRVPVSSNITMSRMSWLVLHGASQSCVTALEHKPTIWALVLTESCLTIKPSLRTAPSQPLHRSHASFGRFLTFTLAVAAFLRFERSNVFKRLPCWQKKLMNSSNSNTVPRTMWYSWL